MKFNRYKYLIFLNLASAGNIKGRDLGRLGISCQHFEFKQARYHLNISTGHLTTLKTIHEPKLIALIVRFEMKR